MIRLRSPEFLGSLSNVPVTSWATRVVANGGVMPSASTIIAMENFRLGMVAAGLDTKMLSLCVFVPDSLIAALTPLFKALGNDPWTNNNFVTGDLTVDGLKGNGTTKYLDTGVRASSGFAYNSVTGNVGMSEIITETAGNASVFDMGHRDSAQRFLALGTSTNFNSVLGRTNFCVFSSNTVSECMSTDWNRTGYVSGNSVSAVSSIYVKTPLTSHSLLTTFARTVAPSPATTTIYGFAYNDRFAVMGPGQPSNKRASVMAIHDGLTISESNTFCTLLMTLRTALGGGTGDEVVNWAARLVSLGGAAPTGTTTSALRTFFSGLNTDGILSKMVVVNCVTPDNLTAAGLPLIWRAGNEQWTNNNFVGGDLTVNGLTGNGSSKSLNTGIIGTDVTGQSPNVTGFSNTSAGITAVISINPGTNGNLFGASGNVAFSHFRLQMIPSTTNYHFYCWGVSGGVSGVNFLTVNMPSPTFIGDVSGNRTASNAIAVYAASTSLSHAALGTGSGASTMAAFGVRDFYAFANNGNGVIGEWTPASMSFMAVHSGLSSAESALFYARIATLRAALGGGNP